LPLSSPAVEAAPLLTAALIHSNYIAYVALEKDSMLKGFRSFAPVTLAFLAFFLSFSFGAGTLSAQSSGTMEGTVKDPSGAAIAYAMVQISNPVSKYERTVTTDAEGKFRFANVPFNPYHVAVKADGFADFSQDAEVRSLVTVSLNIALKVAGANTTVTVEGEGNDLVETESTFHTDVDKNLIDRLPVESASSSFTAITTMVSPGVAADSNGLMHGLGDHASNSISLDGQPITDQFSKVFSNQLPSDAIQSMEIISGAPPAEYGDKTSLVIKATTRSGLGVLRPTGSISASHGSFSTSTAGIDVAFGGSKWGNFVAVNGLQSERFLDPPEFSVMHAKGNQESFFDRVDLQTSEKDTLHLNLSYTRSWFQTPNSFDAQNATAWSSTTTGLDPTACRWGPRINARKSAASISLRAGPGSSAPTRFLRQELSFGRINTIITRAAIRSLTSLPICRARASRKTGASRTPASGPIFPT
jgi:carboxypeptidase family protein/TonB-dependent receptor-like protein